jgi:SAM-dependent methyltransferase
LGYQRDWDELARREPYFAVVTDRNYLLDHLDDDARRRFFESGEADVAGLFDLIRQHVDEFTPESALDYGCGVGRLSRALARRVTRVTGCDVSPEMIAIAKQNVEGVNFTTSLGDERFDLIVSLIVFQHIPTSEGLEILSRLLSMLNRGGVAAIHFTLRRPGGLLRRIARRFRAALPFVHRLAQWASGDALRLPYMQMNEYSCEAIQHRFRAATGAGAIVIPHRDGDIDGAIFIGRCNR